MRTKLSIFAFALFLFAIFIIQNATVVNIRLFFWDIEAPRAMLLIVSFIFGALFWAVLPLKKLLSKDE